MNDTTLHGTCLCGSVRWEVNGPLGPPPSLDAKHPDSGRFSHCHCSRCRKSHGAPFGSYVVAREERFKLTQGREVIARHESSPGMNRPFCSRCGSVVPDGVPWNGVVGMPAGNFDEDPVMRPTAHLFVGSKAPWFQIRDGIVQFDGYPASVGMPALPELPSREEFTGAPRGSCLCGAVTYKIQGAPVRCLTCHCSRCRKAASAGFVSYVVTRVGDLSFTRGADLCTTFKVPDARYFKHVFCSNCGSSMPRLDDERKIAVIPMGSLDDDPGVRPQSHIYVGSKAPWTTIDDDLPRFAEYARG